MDKGCPIPPAAPNTATLLDDVAIVRIEAAADRVVDERQMAAVNSI